MVMDENMEQMTGSHSPTTPDKKVDDQANNDAMSQRPVSLKEKINNMLKLTPQQKKTSSIAALVGALVVALLMITVGINLFKRSQSMEYPYKIDYPLYFEGSQSGEPTPTPSPTSGDMGGKMEDWITYNNEELGFKFKYPKRYEIVRNKNTITGNDDYLNEPEFRIVYFGESKPNFESGELTTGESHTIDGRQGLINKCEAGCGFGGESVSTVIYTTQPPYYKFEAVGYPLDENFSQILSTFEFIDPSEISAKENEFTQ